jgi:hypothetical protein
MKYNWLNVLPFGRTSNTISFFAVKNTVIIIVCAPTPAGSSEWHLLPNRRTFSRMLRCVETRTRYLLQGHQKYLCLTPAKSLTFLSLPQQARLFKNHSRNEGPRAARIFSFPILSEDFLWQYRSWQEVLRDYASTCERTLFEKCLNLSSQSDEWSSRTKRVDSKMDRHLGTDRCVFRVVDWHFTESQTHEIQTWISTLIIMICWIALEATMA